MVSDLSHNSIEARYVATLALRPDLANAIESVLEALGDAEWRVRRAAVGVLVRYNWGESVAANLIAGLASPANVGLRAACAQALERLGDTAVPHLVRGLSEGDPNKRKFVAEILGAIGSDAARDGLGSHLADGDINVASAVAEALGNIGGDAVVERLWHRLKQVDGAEVQQAAYLLEALARAGASISVQDLTPWLNVSTLGRIIPRLLGASGDMAAVELLAQRMLTGSGAKVNLSLAALADLSSMVGDAGTLVIRDRMRGDQALMDVVLAALNVDDDAVVASAVCLLGVVGDPAFSLQILAACTLRSCLAGGVETVQGFGPACVDPILRGIYGVAPETRVLALEIIEVAGDSAAIPECLAIARGVDQRAAETAIRILGALGGHPEIGPLLELATSGDTELRRHAALTLSTLGAKFPEAVATAARSHIHEGGPCFATLYVLGVLGLQDDVGFLCEAAQHSDPIIREAALRATGMHAHDFPEPMFVSAVTDEVAAVRVAAALCLGRYRTDDSRASLLKTMQDSDRWVVAAAAESLGRVRGESAVMPLNAAAQSESGPIALAALNALFKINHESLPDTLVLCARHNDAEVVHEAVRVSMRLSVPEATDLLAGLVDHEAWDVRLAALASIANRRLPLPAETLETCMARESNMLVLEQLEQIAFDQGAAL